MSGSRKTASGEDQRRVDKGGEVLLYEREEGKERMAATRERKAVSSRFVACADMERTGNGREGRARRGVEMVQ